MKGEGQATNGCLLYSHPAQLEDNRDCVLCMTCLKASPHRSVEVNLRPPGIELWTSHIPRIYEVALLFLLLNNVFLRCLPEINQVWGFNINFDNFPVHSLAAIIALSLLTLIPLLAQQIIKNFTTNNRTTFLQLAYGYLPLVLAGNLAHYLTLGLGEAGTIIPLIFATFGLGGENLPVNPGFRGSRYNYSFNICYFWLRGRKFTSFHSSPSSNRFFTRYNFSIWCINFYYFDAKNRPATAENFSPPTFINNSISQFDVVNHSWLLTIYSNLK
jgi:hypothetical protein